MSKDLQIRLFRLRVSVLLPAYLIFAQFCALVGSAILWAARSDLSPLDFAKIYLAFSAIGAVLALARTASVAVWHRIEVSPEGIRSRPGPVEPIYWDAIQTARVVRWAFLSYLEIETGKGRVHRFPLYLADLSGFTELVEQSAGENHPLTWALQEWAAHESDE